MPSLGSVTTTMDAFATADLDATAAAVQATLDERGVGFGSGAERSPFLVDPVPRVIDADDWGLLRRGLAQRGRTPPESCRSA